MWIVLSFHATDETFTKFSATLKEQEHYNKNKLSYESKSETDGTQEAEGTGGTGKWKNSSEHFHGL